MKGNAKLIHLLDVDTAATRWHIRDTKRPIWNVTQDSQGPNQYGQETVLNVVNWSDFSELQLILMQ